MSEFPGLFGIPSMNTHLLPCSTFNSLINNSRRQILNGVYDIHTNIMQYPASMQPTHARIQQVDPAGDWNSQSTSKIFPPCDPRISRNFMVADTYYETPPAGIPSVAYEQCDQNTMLASFRGLGAVSDEIKKLLPPECLKAFNDAVDKENEWKSRWGSESSSTSRRAPIIDKAIVPYSMQS
jgi:chromatin structure-remodeling complex protein RSC7